MHFVNKHPMCTPFPPQASLAFSTPGAVPAFSFPRDQCDRSDVLRSVEELADSCLGLHSYSEPNGSGGNIVTV